MKNLRLRIGKMLSAAGAFLFWFLLGTNQAFADLAEPGILPRNGAAPKIILGIIIVLVVVVVLIIVKKTRKK